MFHSFLFDSFIRQSFKQNSLPANSINIDKELLIKVSQGDESAFGQLFNLYYNQLSDFIMRIAESKPLTQEIVQDVFLKIWINRTSLSEVESFKSYLFVVARNHAFNCLKQIARERNRKKEWVRSVLQDVEYNNNDTSEIDAGALIDAAVELLPPQQKKVYLLSRKEGLKQEEIARELGISLETVKKHMVLALRSIKNYLQAHLGILAFIITGFFKR